MERIAQVGSGNAEAWGGLTERAKQKTSTLARRRGTSSSELNLAVLES